MKSINQFAKENGISPEDLSRVIKEKGIPWKMVNGERCFDDSIESLSKMGEVLDPEGYKQQIIEVKKEEFKARYGDAVDKLRSSPFFDFMIESMIEKDPWCFNATSYYDTCKRTVKIYNNRVTIDRLRDDLELVHRYPKGIPQDRLVHPEHYEGIYFSFIPSGYEPLQAYGNISLNEVRQLFAVVLIEKMMKKKPEISVSDISDSPIYNKSFEEVGTVAEFTYTVPAGTYKKFL